MRWALALSSLFRLSRLIVVAMLLLVNAVLSCLAVQLTIGNPQSLSTTFSLFDNQERNDGSTSTEIVDEEAICIFNCGWSDTCSGVTIKEISQTETVICQLYDTPVDGKEKRLTNAEGSRYVEAETLQNCEELSERNAQSGVHKLTPGDSKVFRASCDMKTDNGGWTMVQLRQDGSVDFNRNWEEYKHGFGNLDGEHWLGLDKMHQLTLPGDVTMRFDMWDGSVHFYAEYKNTTISDESEDYLLDFQSYEGDAGDGMTTMSKGMLFTTRDHDVDERDGSNCAHSAMGGGWYSACGQQNMNGIYTPGVTANRDGIYWEPYKGRYYSLSRFEAKFKRNG